jgi:hypothetical protein
LLFTSGTLLSVITSKAAAGIWRSVEAAFPGLRQHGYNADLLTALAGEDVPDMVAGFFRSGDYWKAHAAFFAFRNGVFLQRNVVLAMAVLAELEVTTEAEGGEELLRRFANAARSEFFRRAGPIPWAPGRTVQTLPFEATDLDGVMKASGYNWDGDQYRKESATTVPEVPPVPAVVALVQKARFDQLTEELIAQMLELADEGLAANDLNGWTTATDKARDALAQVIAGVSAKVGLQTKNQADARKQLTKAGVITPEQEMRVYLIYKAVCETAHKITSRPDAVLDVAVCLVAAEFVLRRFLERPRA